MGPIGLTSEWSIGMRSLFAILLLSLPAFADDWPGWLGPKRDGVWRETGILDKFPAGGPKVLWRTPCGMGYAGPAVANGRVFIAERVLGEGQANPDNPFGRSNVKGTDRLVCLDEATGKKLWKFGYRGRVPRSATPRVREPRRSSTATSSTGSAPMGDLYALDIKTAKPVWQKNYLKDYQASVPVWGFTSHPLVDGDKLICMVGGPEAPGVVAFDKKTGKESGRPSAIAGDPGYNSPVIFEVNGKRILIVWHSQAVVGLDPETGKKLWEHPWEIQAALTAPDGPAGRTSRSCS